MASHVRVVKVGGSLFDLPDLGSRLEHWLTSEPLATNVLVAGGGELADVIRRADERHALGEAKSHWLCVRVLSVTAAWLAALHDRWRLISSWEELTRSVQQSSNESQRRTIVFNPASFLLVTDSSNPKSRLPESWDVTTDSIAARLAERLQADELVLLKSQDQPIYESLEGLAAAGFVDPFFPTAAKEIPNVRFENLRSRL